MNTLCETVAKFMNGHPSLKYLRLCSFLDVSKMLETILDWSPDNISRVVDTVVQILI